MDSVFLAVYGTLLSGEANCRCAEVLSRRPCRITGTLYDTGYGFPVFTPEGKTSVEAELMEIPADELWKIDRLEGYPDLYYREMISVLFPDGTRDRGLIYLMKELPETAQLIPSGNWRDYRRNNMKLEVKWLGINALEFRYPGGSCMIDPYVSRDREKLHVPGEVEKYITGKPDFILLTHAHWDHLADMQEVLERTGSVLYASESACAIMRKLRVPEKQLHPLHYGDILDLPGGVRVTAFESRHMGEPDPRRCKGIADADFSKRENWICGEIFAFLLEIDGYRIFNAGSANLHLPAVEGLECDTFFCGISRWKPGFPELLSHIHYKQLIPTHHDEFRKPLSQFELRDDPQRLKAALPELVMREIPVLAFVPVEP